MSARLRRSLAALILLAAPGLAADLYLAVGGVDGPGCPAGAPCATLAHAITQASATGGDVIHVGDGTFSGIASIDRPITIQGTGRSVLDGGGAGTVLRFRGGGELTLRGLEVRGGLVNFGGGGLDAWLGTILVADCVFTANVGGYASAIYQDGGSLTMRRTTVSDNGLPDDSGSAVRSWHGVFDIEDCRIERNAGLVNGVGLHVGEGSVGTVRRTVIRDNLGNTGAFGAGVYVSGRVEISDSDISNNYGGGVVTGYFVRGEAILDRCTITGNTAIAGGGVNNGGVVVLRDCLVAGNTSESNGGGVHNNDTAWIERCAIIDNRATVFNADGGGIYNSDSSRADAVMTLVNSTVSGNFAPRNGGGIRSSGGSELHAYNCTITNNSAGERGGGLWERDAGTIVEVAATIIAGNTAGICCPDVLGEWTSLGYNVIGDDIGSSATGATATDLVGVDPLLGPLGDNGGTLPTHALRAGSPAIDSGDPAGCLGPAGSVLADDQIGAPRPTDGDCDAIVICDRGAFESVACGGGALALYESAQPQAVVQPGNLVGSPTVSPHGHAPAAGALLFYQIDDGAGAPALISVAKGGPGLLFSW